MHVCIREARATSRKHSLIVFTIVLVALVCGIIAPQTLCRDTAPVTALAEEPAEADQPAEESSIDDNAAATALSFAEELRPQMLQQILGEPSGLVLDAAPVIQHEDKWSFSMYYIGYTNAHASEKNDSVMNLIGDAEEGTQPVKYQFEFHNSVDIEEGEARIVIPRALYTDRNGNPVVPSDIGVPEAPGASATSPFNYTIEEVDGVECLVFTNHRKIFAGSDDLVQVFYQLDDMAAVDASSDADGRAVWTIPATVTVAGDTYTAEPALTGQMDTGTTLTETTQNAYEQTGRNYYPELYTWAQVAAWSEPGATKPDDFDDYHYMLWRTVIRADASQPWTLTATTTPSHDGEVVYQKLYDHWDYPDASLLQAQTGAELTYGENALYHLSDQYSTAYLYTLVRYPVSSTPEGTTITNDVAVTLTGTDDAITHELDSSATHTWENYEWVYEGDIAGFRKGYSYWDRIKSQQISEPAWIDLYQLAAAHGQDFALPDGWQSHTTMRWYSTILAGEPSYKTIMVDDHEYVRSNTSTYVEMTDADFYYRDVTFTVNEYDIDIYEDARVPLTTGKPFDVYVMVRDSSTWQLVASVPFDEINGWHLPDDWVSQGVWKVKVEHEAGAYSSEITMDATACIRKDSPTVQALLADETTTSLYFMDASGMYAQSGSQYLYRDPSAIVDIGGNLADSITAQDQELYGGSLIRSSDQIAVTRLSPTNGVNKIQRYQNDPLNSRIDVTYTIAGYDGYELFNADYVDVLKAEGVSASRESAVVYDLLPLGVTFDPSQPVKVGRVTSLYYTMSDLESGSWNTADTSVDYQVTDNYKNSGRQLVTFTITYTGDELNEGVSSSSSATWYAGFGVQFGAYVKWEDLHTVNEAVNVAAYGASPDDSGYRALKGSAYTDDGSGVPSSVGTDADGRSLYYDVDGDDEVSATPWLIYASAAFSADVALSASADIDKYVRADDAPYAEYLTDAEVEVGKGYTYSIQVNSANNKTKNIIIYDCLEDGIQNHKALGDPRTFDSSSWHGTFTGLNLAAAREKGIEPKVFYSTNNNQPRRLYEEDGSLCEGWVAEGSWTLGLADVQAVAVDLTTNADGTPFVLEPTESVKIMVRMLAPAELQEATYAYNVAAFDATVIAMDGTETHQTETMGDSTAVRLYQAVPLEISKTVTNDGVDHTGETFTFTVTIDGAVYAEEEYDLYLADNTKASGIHATNKNGELTLEAGQRAVFPSVPSGGAFSVTEAESPWWQPSPDSTISGTIPADGAKAAFTNTPVYPLYIDKAVNEAQDYTDLDNTRFTFTLTINGTLAANHAYYLVNRETAVSRDPAILSGPLYTDAQGRLTLTANERAMVQLHQGDTWEVHETDIPEGFTAVNDTAAGTIAGAWAQATITNRYTLKDLYVTKTVDALAGTVYDTSQAFTFTLTVNGEARNAPYYIEELVSTQAQSSWQVVVDDSSDANGLRTMTDATFSLKAGQRARITHLPADAAWIVHEAADESGQFTYETPEDGTASGTLPVHALSSSTAFVNQSLVRTLAVNKTVVAETATDTRFTYTLTINGQPAADAPYTLSSGDATTSLSTDAQGTFTLASGETATFTGLHANDTYLVHEDAVEGFTQISPAGDATGTLPADLQATSVGFVNKDDSAQNILVLKKYVTGDDAAAIRDLESGSYTLFPGEFTRHSSYGQTWWNYSSHMESHSNIYGAGTWHAFHLDVRDSAGNLKEGAVSYTLIDAQGDAYEFHTLGSRDELYYNRQLEYSFFYPSDNDATYRQAHESGELNDSSWQSYVNERTVTWHVSPYNFLDTTTGAELDSFTIGDFAMRSTDTIIFTGLDQGDTLTITEYQRPQTAEDGFYLDGSTGSDMYLLDQTAPENHAPVQGTAGSDSLLSFTNTLSEPEVEIRFYKNLNYDNIYDALGDTEGSITFRIQLRDKDGTVSTPQGAFKYTAWDKYYYEYGESDDEGYFTWHFTNRNPDGRSSTYNAYIDGGIPWGYDFKIEEIDATPAEVMGVLEGIVSNTKNLRRDADGFWCLNEYMDENGQENYFDWNLSNLSDTTTFTVTKQLGESSPQTDEDFGFTIYESDPLAGREDSAAGSTSQEQYTLEPVTYHAWANQRYRIYSAGTSEFVGYGRTDAAGHFTIKAGQYAEFDRPYSSVWEGYYRQNSDGTTYWRNDDYWNGFWDNEYGHLRYRVVEDTHADYTTQITVDKHHTGSTYQRNGWTYYQVKNEHTQYTIDGTEAVVYTDEDLTFTNSKEEKASLVITKTVQNATEQAADDEFTFTVSIDGQPYKNEEYRLYDATGELFNTVSVNGYTVTEPWTTDSFGTLTLKDDQRAVFEWVGAGKRYTVTEDAKTGYVQLNPAQGSLNGTMTASGAVAAFTNLYEPETSSSTLTIRKLLALPEGVSASAVPDETFVFEVTVNGQPLTMTDYQVYQNDGTLVSAEGDTGEEGRVLIHGGQYALISIPANSDYTVTEVTDSQSAFTPVGSTTREGATSTTGASETFVNTFGSLLIQKRVTTDSGTAPANDTFTFVISTNGAPLANAPVRILSPAGAFVETQQTSSDGSFTLKAGQQALFSGLAENTTYHVVEVSAHNYTQTVPTSASGYTGIIGQTADKLVFENAYTPSTDFLTSVTVIKRWDDESATTASHPAIVVHLLQNGVQTGQTLTLSEENGWSGTFTHLPTYTDDQAAVYSVGEDVPEGYTAAVTSDDAGTFTIVNTPIPPKPEPLTITGTKTWDDQDNKDGSRPSSITVRLYNGDEEVAHAQVSADDGWSWTFEGLARTDENGADITYTISEDAVEGYTTTYNGYNITNTHTPKNPDPDPGKPDTPDKPAVPDTGDHSPLWWYVVVAAAAAILALTSVIMLRRQKAAHRSSHNRHTASARTVHRR